MECPPALDVDVEGAVPKFFLGGHRVAVYLNPGIIDQDVQPAEALHRLVDCSARLGGPGYVRSQN